MLRNEKILMYGKWKELLRQVTLFDGIPVEETIQMLECLWPRLEVYARDEYAFLAGDEVRGSGVVLSGRVAVLKENALGQQMIMTLVGPGEMFGEVAAFSSASCYPASVRVLEEETTIVYLSVEQVTGICEKSCFSHRKMMANMLKILAQKAMLLNRKVEFLSVKSIRGKVCALLFERYRQKGEATFEMPMNRSEMAEYLHIPRPSLSRELCNLRDEGMLSFDRSLFTINDIDQLRKCLAQV